MSEDRMPLSTRRRVVRLPQEGLVGGVAAGIAEAYELDPWLVRAVLIGAAVVNGLGILVYAACWIFLPAASTR